MNSNRKLLTGGALAALAVLFVAAILISNTLFRGVRLDLTQNRLYTLSDGTRKILGGIDDPINLYFFFSDKGTRDLPQVRVFAQSVRDLLDEMVSRSNGKIKLQVIDPQPFSEDEDRATALGIQAVPGGPGGENLYLGLAGTNSTNGKAVIPFLQAEKEGFLEYDITKLVNELSNPKKPAVGLVSGLPMVGFDPVVRQMREPWAVETQLRQAFDVKDLQAETLKTIDPDLKVVIVVHPKNLSDDAQYALDQFVMRGGRLLVFVDPNAEADESGANPQDPRAALMADKSSDLPTLFKAWGIDYNKEQAVLDRSHAVQVNTGQGRPVRVASILRFGKRDMSAEDVTTAYLERINASSLGSFQLTKDSKLKLTPLIETGTEAMVVPVERVKFLADPAQLMVDYQPGNERRVIAGRLQGKLTSAFPQRKDAPGHLAEAKGDGEIILVTDTDLLTNRLWVQMQNVYGQKVPNAFANNGDFFLNAVDFLAGSSDLMSVRGRAISHRPFTRVEEMKRVAEESFRGKERELQQQLNATDRRLTEMQAAKGKANEPLIIGPEQQKEIQNYMQKKVEIRKELRQVRRGLDEQIDGLGARLKFINIALVPVVLTIAALAFVWLRRRPRTA